MNRPSAHIRQPRDAARRLQQIGAAACLLVATAASAGAAPVTVGHVSAELVAEHETIHAGEAFDVAVALKPAAGWHTYWQNSGDSGLPTRVSWKLPDGFRTGELQWPHPVRLGDAPLVTFGYEADSLLLARIEPPKDLRDGTKVPLTAAVQWLACREDACVPGRAELSLELPVSSSVPRADSRWSAAFAAARAALPRRAEGWRAVATDDGKTVRVEVTAPGGKLPPASAIDVFAIQPGVLDASAAPIVRPTASGLVVEVARDEKAAPLPETLALVLVSREGWNDSGQGRALAVNAVRGAGAAAVASAPAAVEKLEGNVAGAVADGTVPALPPAAEPAPAASGADPPPALTLWAAVVLAFAGGLVLNLMPCVFPVLSLKILGFVHVAHHQPAVVRRHGYAFATGVILSFWVLAGVLMLLRAAGGALGWGFQLQEPLFVAAMAALLTLMALNLFGVFEIGGAIAGRAGRFDSESGYRGSFFSGALATVLATPCTAPFMGSAIGYALVQPPSASLAVFTSLGVGMASPYLLLACAPALIRRLPRPGAWMERFREAMAFPLLATVAWLVWVFGQQTGNDGVLKLLVALLLASMAAWLFGRAAAGRNIGRLASALCLAAAVAVTLSAAGQRAVAPASVVDGMLAWQPWDPDAIGRHRSEGRVVFVDFTADWCLSCKVNERVALTGEEFTSRMSHANAVAMKADWTSADPRITRALADFGRSGVPLYVVYPRDPAREPIVLPQILTPAIVQEALDKAACDHTLTTC